MTVLKNEGRWDRSNVIYDGGRVSLYAKNADPPDASAHAVHRLWFVGAAARCDRGASRKPIFDLSAVFHRLSLEGQLAGYEVTERFYEIGSPEGLRDLEAYLTS